MRPKHDLNYSEAPLTRLNFLDVPFEWSEECELSFRKLKEFLNIAPILTLPIEGERIMVYCDASGVILCCVLMQQVRAIAFASRAEGAAIVRWDVFESTFMGRFFPRELREANAKKEKLNDREEFRNKRANTTGHEPGQQKTGNVNRSSFQQKLTSPAPSSSSAPAPNNKGACRDGSNGFFKCGQISHFMRECPKNRKFNGTERGVNRLYAITSRQVQENSPITRGGVL
ncbi:hypothetical protein MTR67_044010 [Solanum verrucosum]|uniref:Reverse transcriptase/retrotransposon-derived protein RNase H-like domain-containing protein n=1 Tax=Solanum verrucosum TaxID=315347 RepID=A0AAF0URE4_SOLVR|nr:hypothetical protein MTR67_044010 [Solanum verrucosum]